MSQLTLTSDPLGTATTGTFEFENPAFFMTGATSQRGAVLVDQYTVLQATNTLTSQTAAQALFDVTGSGQVTLVAGTYEFECVFSVRLVRLVLIWAAAQLSLSIGGRLPTRPH